MFSSGFDMPVDDFAAFSSFSTIPSQSESFSRYSSQNQNLSHQVELEDAFSRLSVSPSTLNRPQVDPVSHIFPYSYGLPPTQTSDQRRMGIGIGMGNGIGIGFNNNDLVPNNAFGSSYDAENLWKNHLIGADIDNRMLNGYGLSIKRAPSSNADSEQQNFRSSFVNQSLGESSGMSVPLVNSYVNLKRSPHWFDNFRGRVLSMAKDQHGSRDLQELMKKSGMEGISLIFNELKDHITDLVFDPFGNYVVQKMAEVCSKEQRNVIIQNVTYDHIMFFGMCISPHGSRAVEKLLEHVTTREQRNLIMSALNYGAITLIEVIKGHCVVLIPGATILCKDINSHRVVLYCLKHFAHQDTKQFLHVVANNTFDIAKDKTGCCVLQQCVDHSQGETRDRLIDDIIKNASELADDCYGNYVVQHLLSLKIPSVTNRILDNLETKFVELSCNKYGSNVVEKFFQDSGEHQSRRIIWELLHSPQVEKLLVDPFGNYVIKSALLVSKGFFRNALLQLIQNNSEMMRTNLYGKKLLDKCDRGRIHHM